MRNLRRAGYRIPEDVGVAYHTLDEKSRFLSGMKKNSWQIGVMAVYLLIDMLAQSVALDPRAFNHQQVRMERNSPLVAIRRSVSRRLPRFQTPKSTV